MITDTAFFRNPYYHRSSDTRDKLDYRFMAELVESLLLFFKSQRRFLSRDLTVRFWLVYKG
jgi:hypothetical protein